VTKVQWPLSGKIESHAGRWLIIEACVVCANAYGVTEDLKALGFDVKGMGKPLTEYLKSGKKVLTF